MDLKRRVAMASLTLSVAFAAGQYVQHGLSIPFLKSAAAANPVPQKIVELAADNDPVVQIPAAPDMIPLPSPQRLTIRSFDYPADLALPIDPVPPAPLRADLSLPDCTVSLGLTSEPDAMLGLELLSPCRPGERVVLRHGGLAVTAKTSSSGALTASLPAMDRDGNVSVLFSDGEIVQAALPVPDMEGVHRFGVQWLADDAFQVHALENGAGYGTPGHVSAVDPHMPAPGDESQRGFLSLLGDSEVNLPMLAEVYSYPTLPGERADVEIQAAVTEKTCGRELLGETLESRGGRVTVSELSLAMPGCEALGDYLVLKNLPGDMSIAAAN